MPTPEGLVLGVPRTTLEVEEVVLQPALWLGLEATIEADLAGDALAWGEGILESRLGVEATFDVALILRNWSLVPNRSPPQLR